jgi:hypothetical protein
VLVLAILALTIATLLNGVVVICVGVLGFVFTWLFHNGDKHKRTTDLFYQLADEARQKFTSRQAAFDALSKSYRVWLVTQEQATWDRKRNAGALSLLSRSPVRVGIGEPPWIKTNVSVWSIGLGALTLYFFPDRVLVWDSSKYGAISYESLGVTFAPTRFIESDNVPGDSEVVDQTWQYLNKDGSPDQRFAHNRRLPVVLYGSLILTSQAELTAGRTSCALRVLLDVSNQNLALRFAEAFKARVQQNHTGYDSRTRANYSASQTQSRVSSDQRTSEPGREPQIPQNKVKQTSAWDVLGVRVGANMDEIRVAYHRMAQMYHPDKVATLGPEFRVLAEQRMKEINSAYDVLKSR